MPDQLETMLTDIAKAAGEATVLHPSAAIRRRGEQRRNRHRAAVGVLAVAGVGAVLAATSLFGTHRTPDNYLPAATPSAIATASSPTPSPNATDPSSISVPPATATQLGVTITGPSPQVTMSLGGNEVDVTVTVTNPTGHAFTRVKPLVYVGKCSCSDNPVRIGPAGTMKLKQPDGSWKPVEYGREGGGMDYVDAEQVPALTLAPGATVSFTYRIGFNATQSVKYRSGDLKVGVLMVALPGYSAVGPTRAVGGGITILGRDASPLAFVPVHLTVD